MTHIEQAIKEAANAGWKNLDKENEGFTRHFIEGWIKAGRANDAFLDPSFWQAIGKAKGWNAWVYNADGRQDEWLFHWHRFIDHLAEGKDAESFFSSLN